MPYSLQTFKANTVGVGFSEDLTASAGKLAITNNTTDEIFVKVGNGTKPSTPTNAYIPGNDATVATYGIKPGVTITLGEDVEGGGYKEGVQEKITWIAGWCVAAGKVAWAGH